SHSMTSGGERLASAILSARPDSTSTRRAASVNSAPCCASCSASSSPMPEEAPVMRITLPRKAPAVLTMPTCNLSVGCWARTDACARVSCRGSSPRDRQATRDCGPRDERCQGTAHLWEVVNADELACAVESDQVAYPGEHRHVSDGVGITQQPRA